MPPLVNQGHEAFARARAAGLTPRAAFLEAGYRDPARNVRRIASRPEVEKRIVELERDAAWGGSGNLKPVIDELMRLAQVAGKLRSAAGMTAARGLLGEAARLKGLLDAQSHRADVADPPRRVRLSNDEWLAKYAPPR